MEYVVQESIGLDLSMHCLVEVMGSVSHFGFY